MNQERTDWKAVENSLDDLFDDITPFIKKAPEPKAVTASESFLSTYSNPANWRGGRAIALIHQPSATLIGKFRELFHLRVENVRRLVRLESPTLVSGTEEVTEDWWIKGRTFTEKGSDSATVRNCVIETLILSELRASAPEVNLRVILSWGAIRRIELISPTSFETEAGALLLPAGLDILKGLSFEAKVEIKKAVGL